jgi:enterochelin esterase-like enzyme
VIGNESSTGGGTNAHCTAAPCGGITDGFHIRVRYPVESGRIVLRTDTNWDENVEACEVSQDGTLFEFALPPGPAYTYFKPVLVGNGDVRWAIGPNYLAVQRSPVAVETFPTFHEDAHCSACDLRHIRSDETDSTHGYRVFYPPGYDENPFKRYPVLYMQDGQNLFFPDEAFQGNHWRVTETLSLLTDMNAIRRVIVVGVYPNDRMEDYTYPGYEAYGRFLVHTLKPAVDHEFRTLGDSSHTAVMGSSLGGVVSFYLAWEWPAVFGMAGCMSSTFGWRDDLRERVSSESPRDVRFYLDSGWPGDNYEVTRDMHARLLDRGYRQGEDVLYFGFPEALHNERYWAMRSHLPYQFFYGRWRSQQ